MSKSVTVNANREKAFDVFVNHFSAWWPADYTWSQDVLEAIVIEPKVNGRCFERGPFGFLCDWGRVVRFDPPQSLVFTWQISPAREPVPDPAKASEVEVSFLGDDTGGIRLNLEHRGFTRHGEGWENYLEAMDSAQGWKWILEQYREYVDKIK